MSTTMAPYVVQKGDHLARLAFQRGFDAEEVWRHPSNAELRELRRDPCILAPGDVLHIPDPAKRGLAFSSGTTNRYVARVPRMDVHLVIHDQLGTPLPDEPYVIEGLGDAVERRTDQDGAASFAAPVHVREATLLFTRRNVRLAVRIGDLDPLEEMSGVAARLANLRFLDSHTGWTGEQLEEALMAFQHGLGLAMTGTLDEATRGALRDAHAWQLDARERTP